MSQNDQDYTSGVGMRGPNYNWEHEANYYRLECESLRLMIDQLDSSVDGLAWENYILKQGLKILSKGVLPNGDCVDGSVVEFVNDLLGRDK